MNRILRKGLGAALLSLSVGVISCKDYLEVDPLAVDTPQNIFSTLSGATSAIIGAYDPLSGDPGYGNRLNSYYPFDSDEMQSSQGGDDAGAGRRGIARYNSIPTNAEVLNPWNQLYQGIERCNTCIRYIPQMSQYNAGGADQTAARRLHGEALVLRAQYYFELIRNWGDVPAPFTPSEAGQDFNVTRTDRDEIYERLLADLAVADELLPWRTAVAADERITKGAAKALRARVAMYRGGFSLRQDGQIRRGSDYQRFYDTARVECSELMAQRAQHDLNTSYEETFRSINELRRDLKREIIFEVGMGGGSAASDSKLGYYNGPRINGPSPRFGLSSGAVTALPTYFYAFDSTDVRRDVTLAPYTIEANDLQRAQTLINCYDGKFRRDWRVPLISASAVQSLGYNWPIIRFADVLLMFAEAQNDLAGPDAPYRGVTARQALMEVRLRGFGGNATRAAAAGNPPTDKDGFFTALVKERFLEFGGEGIRKYDLIRWNLLTSRLAQTKADLTEMLSASTSTRFSYIPLTAYFTSSATTGLRFARSLYRPAPATTPTGTTSIAWRSSITAARIADIASGYTPNRQLLPIPASAINTNGNLVQNPGY